MSGFHPFGGRVSRRFNERNDPHEAYLSYHDVRLTRLDFDSIKGDWLTDNAIAFWEEYLEREQLSKFPQASISLLRPSMAFMILQTQNPMSLREVLPDFRKTTHIFLPINDNDNVNEAEGGTHWSLLLVSTIDRKAFHYDSLGDANIKYAQRVCRKLEPLCDPREPRDQAAGYYSNNSVGSFRLDFFNMEDSPCQNNSSDCGVYVCLIMRHLLLKRLLRVNSDKKVSMSMIERDVDARKGRYEMCKIIDAFVEEGKKRKSRSHSRHNSPPRIGE